MRLIQAIHLSLILTSLISLASWSSMPDGSGTVELTGNGLGPSQPQIPAKEAPALKRSIAAQKVTDSHRVIALIYESSRGCEECTTQETNDVMQLISGTIQSRMHLQQARIWRAENQ